MGSVAQSAHSGREVQRLQFGHTFRVAADRGYAPVSQRARKLSSLSRRRLWHTIRRTPVEFRQTDTMVAHQTIIQQTSHYSLFSIIHLIATMCLIQLKPALHESFLTLIEAYVSLCRA